MQTDLITKVYFNEHLTHSCVGMPQGLQALSSSFVSHGTIYMAPYIVLLLFLTIPVANIWCDIVIQIRVFVKLIFVY